MSELLTAMRTMAWERAVGELRAMMHTYYKKYDGDKFEKISQAIDSFISTVEGEGWQE